MRRCAGLEVLTDCGIAVGTNVALSAPLPVAHIEATCRIIAVVDEPDRFGFAYGTLRVHLEQGEESFIVSRSGSAVQFDVLAVSRPVHLLARLIGAATYLQHVAARRYLAAMQTAATAAT